MTPEGKNENCSKLEPHLEDYVSGDLPRAAAEQLAAHFDACGNCRIALDDARIASKLVAAAFEPAPDPGPAFARMVMARIDAAERWIQGQRTFWRPFEVVAWRLAFSAALALVFLFAYGIRAGYQLPPSSGPAVSAQQQPDVFTIPVSSVPSNGDEVLMAIAEHRHER